MLAAAHPRAKSPEAFRTISEVSDELDVPQHVLRFWESRFAQIRPVKRAGGRRYYRPEDIDLLRGIRALLYSDGYTIKGVQKILRDRGIRNVAEIGRGEAEAEAPIVRAVEIESPSVIEASAEEPAEAMFDDAAPTYARAAIALVERAHLEPEAAQADVMQPEAIATEAAAVGPEVAPVFGPEDGALSGEQRVKLEFLLAELLSLKKRLNSGK